MMSVDQPSATVRPAVLLAGSPSPRRGHVPFATDLIAAVKPSTIVQLGVSNGDTYFGYCQFVSENALACACYGIDTWRGSNATEGDVMYEAASRHNSSKYKTFSHLVRKSFDEALPQFSDESIDVLDLDGEKPYETLKQVFEWWLPKVKPGGIVLLNGISQCCETTGAMRLWDELHTEFPHFAFGHEGGLGVMGKTKEAEKAPFVGDLFRASQSEQERTRRYYLMCAERMEMTARLSTVEKSEGNYTWLRVFASQDGNYATAPEWNYLVDSGGWCNIRVDLPRGLGDQALRLDVANRPAVVDIAVLSLRKAEGQSIWNWNPKDTTDLLRIEGTATRMPAAEFCRVLSLGASPSVYLPEFRGVTFNQPLQLDIRLRVDLELTAVRSMNQRLSDLEKATAQLKAKDRNGSGLSSAALEAAVAKAKNEAGKQLEQARIEHETKIRQITSDAEARLEAMRLEFEHQAGQQRLQMEDERRVHQITLLERDQLSAQHPRMLQEISIAQGNVEELKAELERLSSEMASMDYDLTELRKLNARMAAALEEERSTRLTMQDSSSWQLTKPFRAVGDLFGPRKKY